MTGEDLPGSAAHKYIEERNQKRSNIADIAEHRAIFTLNGRGRRNISGIPPGGGRSPRPSAEGRADFGVAGRPLDGNTIAAVTTG